MPIENRAFSLIDRYSDIHLSPSLQLSRLLKGNFPGGPDSNKLERELLPFTGHGGALSTSKALKA